MRLDWFKEICAETDYLLIGRVLRMCKKEKYFAKEIPSLFVVASPFQVLCAFEAIKKFKIKEYSIVAVFEKNDPRNDQLVSVLDFLKLDYSRLDRSNHSLLHELLDFRNWFGCRKGGKVKRAFVGYFRDFSCILLALGFLGRNSTIVYLDDGNASIAHLNGTSKFNKKEKLCIFILKAICLFRKINMGPAYFTIYSDIPTKIPCESNLLEFLGKDCSPKKEGVYFIGTNPTVYSSTQGFSLKQYFSLLDRALGELKNEFPSASLYYVYHGRDKFVEETNQVLKRYGYQSLKPKENVELYFVQQRINPIMVSGFMSTALYTIKKLRHDAQIGGFMIENNMAYIDKFDYYKRHGIEIRLLKLDG